MSAGILRMARPVYAALVLGTMTGTVFAQARQRTRARG
jgi:hypothetical protein